MCPPIEFHPMAFMHHHVCTHVFFWVDMSYLYNYWHKGKGWEGKGSETNWCENTCISIPPTCESFIKGVMTFRLWASAQNGTRQRKKAWHEPKTMKHNFKQMKEDYGMEPLTK